MSAAAQYRELWGRFLRGESERLSATLSSPTRELRVAMDALQPLVQSEVDWAEFRESLPGYVEWWRELEAHLAFQDASRRLAVRKRLTSPVGNG